MKQNVRFVPIVVSGDPEARKAFLESINKGLGIDEMTLLEEEYGSKLPEIRAILERKLVSGSFTPGPWQYNGKTDVYDATGATVCELYKGYNTSVECHANAILIAAAPDLLTALEQIIRRFDEGRNIEGHCIGDARTAIEKALGQIGREGAEV